MSDAAPFFSVIIPVYNRAHILGVALRSVLAQSEQDFEIIVVDDGSYDNPRQVADDIGDPRIRVIRQENRGGGAARNRGIDEARGRFIAFLDSDDEFLPRHLETMKRLLDGTSHTVGYARMIVDRGRGRTLLKPPRAIRPGEHMATYLLCDRGFVPTITLAVATEVAKRVRYDENLPCAQDTDFAIRLYLAGCKFVMASEADALCSDVHDPNRISAGRKSAPLAQWLEGMRPNIPAKAYYGCRGWMIAKGAVTTDASSSLRFYLSALWHGCYRPSLAGIIFLQIFLPDRLYRRIANGAISLLQATANT
jgi:glycosyltransferase involved in cell wall biosynthesis